MLKKFDSTHSHYRQCYFAKALVKLLAVCVCYSILSSIAVYLVLYYFESF